VQRFGQQVCEAEGEEGHRESAEENEMKENTAPTRRLCGGGERSSLV